MAVNPIDWKQNRSAADTTYRTSPAIWADCPWGDILDGSRPGFAHYDNFQQQPLQGTLTTQISNGQYKVFGDSGNTISKVSQVNSANVFGGALQFAFDTDNDGLSMADAYQSLAMSGTTAASGKLWFECCYAQNSIATNMMAVFIGLAETGLWTLSSTVPFNDADTLDNSAAAIGFYILEDGLGVVNFGYADRATSFTGVQTSIKTLAANTFTKLGFVYDPTRSADCVRVFVDNVETSTPMTKAALVALTNLDAALLGRIFCATADSGATSAKAYMKWWKVAQLAP